MLAARPGFGRGAGCRLAVVETIWGLNLKKSRKIGPKALNKNPNCFTIVPNLKLTLFQV
jgi:hypothetical protein